MTRQKQIEKWLEAVASLESASDYQAEEAVARDVLRRYRAREWFVLLVGETSAGKSSFANALLGEDLLPATADPTTVVPVEIRITDQDEPSFEASFRDGTSLIITRARFQETCRTPGDTRRLHVYWPSAKARTGLVRAALRGLVLVDAPGFNSCIREHEAILTEVLPEADAVLFMLNFRRGVTPEDLYFLELLKNLGGDDGDPPIFGTNWCPANGGDRQLIQMRNNVRRCWPQAELHVMRTDGAPGRVKPWADSLWGELLTRTAGLDRGQRLDRRAVQIGRLLLARLQEDLALRYKVISLQEESVGVVRQALEDLRGTYSKALADIDAAEKQGHRTVDEWLKSTQFDIRAAAMAPIDEANRFTEAGPCAAFVGEHVLPHGMREAEDKLAHLLLDVSEELGTKLDSLAQKAGRVEASVLELPGESLEERARGVFASHGIEIATKDLFNRYLAKMGGAGGVKAGIVNLGKKVVSKAAGVFDRTLSKEVYASMGQTMKKLGISASRAANVIAIVVVELAAYLYRTVRWKKKLRAGIDKALGFTPDEPLEDELIRAVAFWRKPDSPSALEEWAVKGHEHFISAMEATRRAVGDNFSRRISVLEDALVARASASPEGAGVLKFNYRQMEKLAEDSNLLEGEI